MNSFCQLESYLIASEEAAAKLASAETARLLVFSDTHGGKSNLNRVLAYFGSHMDALVFCGDGIGDLLSIMEEEAAIKQAEKAAGSAESESCIPPVVAFVSGNNDPGSYPFSVPNADLSGNVLQSVKVPACLVFQVCGHKIFLAHGHRYGVYSTLEDFKLEAKIVGADFAFFGHTHIPQLVSNECLMLNPGSLCLPRGGTSPSFAVVTVYSGKKNADVTFYRAASLCGNETYRPYNPESISFW